MFRRISPRQHGLLAERRKVPVVVFGPFPLRLRRQQACAPRGPCAKTPQTAPDAKHLTGGAVCWSGSAPSPKWSL